MKIYKGFLGMKLQLILLLGIFLILSFGFVTVNAADSSHIYVSTSGNDSWNGQAASYNSSNIGPKKTIKNGINTVNTGGTLNLASGTFNEYNLVISKNMVLQGTGVSKTVINGNNKGYILKINDNVKFTISGVTFINGMSSYGGAIHNSGILNMSYSKFLNNSSPNYAGAIYNGGILTEKYVTYTGNFATNGACILNDLGSTMTSNNCIFTSNHVTGSGSGVGYGAAIQNLGTGYLTNDYFSYNKGFEGAAIFNHGNLNANNCTFKYNTAQSTAGAIDTYHGTTILSYCNFINNHSNIFGGALYVDTVEGITDTILSMLIINHCNFTGNSADLDGGAAHNYRGNVIISSSIFTNNKSNRYGGAISNYCGTLKLNNNIYTNNIANLGNTIDQWNLAGNILPQTTSSFALANIPLKVSSTNPVNLKIGVSRTSPIVIKFNENIKKGNMWIELRNSIGKVIPITTSIIGNVLTIKHSSILSKSTKYKVIIHTGSIKDLAGNPIALYTTNFTTTTI